MDKDFPLRKPYDHFVEAPKNIKLPHLQECRNEANPDLAILVDLSHQRDIMRFRQEVDERLATDPSLQELFYDAVPDENLHATVQRIGLADDFTPEKIEEICDSLEEQFRDFEAISDLTLGENIDFGDAIIMLMEQSEKLNSMHRMANSALQNTGIYLPNGRFRWHGSDRYAAKQKRIDIPRLRRLFEKDPIEPAQMHVDNIIVTKEWPVVDRGCNEGAYHWKVVREVIARS